MSQLKIGIVGLGDQGAPMAEAISDAGFELHVWARRAQSFDAIFSVKDFRQDSLESLAVTVDVLSLCLRDDEDIWNLIRQHRLIPALRSGSMSSTTASAILPRTNPSAHSSPNQRSSI